MKDDIVKFHKICTSLLKRGYSNSKIYKEMGISDPTFQKLLTVDLTDPKGIRVSTLAMIQDFNKKHIEEFNYDGIEPIKITPENKEQVENAIKLSKHSYFSDKKEEDKPTPTKGEPTIPPFAQFLSALAQTIHLIPSNVSIHISINEKVTD